MTRFFNALSAVEMRAREIALQIAREYDAYSWTACWYDGSLVERIRNGRIVVRVLHYGERYLYDAYPHVDRPLFTVHFHSTHRGLRFLSPHGDILETNEKSYESVTVFPGEKFVAITRGKLGLGTMHDVLYDRVNDEDRFSFMAFVHPEARSDDCSWLLANHQKIKDYEQAARKHFC